MAAAEVRPGGKYRGVDVADGFELGAGDPVTFTDCIIRGSIVTYAPIHLERCRVEGGLYAYDVGGTLRRVVIDSPAGQAFRPGLSEGGGWARHTPWIVEDSELRIGPGDEGAHVEAVQVLGGDGLVFRRVVFDSGCPFNNTQTADLSLNAANTLVEDSVFAGCSGYAIYSDGPNNRIVRPTFSMRHVFGEVYRGEGRIDPIIVDPRYER